MGEACKNFLSTAVSGGSKGPAGVRVVWAEGVCGKGLGTHGVGVQAVGGLGAEGVWARIGGLQELPIHSSERRQQGPCGVGV